MTAFASLSTDMYLPSMPMIAAEFGTSTASVQPTVSTFVLGLSIGQLVFGGLSDLHGRRPPLMVGMVLYVLATTACMMAQTLPMLLAARFIQGFAACSGQVIARAVVSDRYDRESSASIFSWMQLVMGVAPIAAPVFGGILLAHLGWRSLFGLMLAIGIAIALSCYFRLDESRSAATAELARREPRRRAFAALLRRRPIVGHLIAGGCSTGCLFTWISMSPGLFIEHYGFNPQTFSYLFAATAACLIGAGQLNRVLLRRFPSRRILDVITVGGALAGIAATVLAALHLTPLPVVIVGQALLISTLGLIPANNQACALALDHQRSGSLSALLGSSSFAIGACTSWLASLFSHPGPVPLFAMMACLLGGCFLTLQFIVGHPSEEKEARPDESSGPVDEMI